MVMVSNVTLAKAIEQQGFSLEDCPYTPIKAEWEDLPIVKAIRTAERLTGTTYSHPGPTERGALT